jgi:hypothetical protein
VFDEHRAQRMHSVGTYYLASCLADVPFLFLETWLIATLQYWMVGLPAIAATYFYHLFGMFSIGLFSAAFARFITTFAPDLSLANNIGSPVLAVFCW